MKSFFRACGFTISDFPGCHIYEGKLSELIELKDYKSNIQGKPVFDLTAEEQREIENDLEHDPNAFVFRFDPKTCLPESRYIRNQDGLQALLML